MALGFRAGVWASDICGSDELGAMKTAKILILFDTDRQPNSFDRVVAIDAGVDQLFAYGNVALDQVEALVHGAIFTRGPKDLGGTAIFIGGSSVVAGEEVLERVTSSFLGPLSVSVMLDSNGANTTAAAAVLSARRHLELSQTTALVLAGTGPVGQRAARLLAHEGATVRLASRSGQRAANAAEAINKVLEKNQVLPCVSSDDATLAKALHGTELVIAAGASGVELLPQAAVTAVPTLKVAIDLNAVPPLGIEGINTTDKAAPLGSIKVYGAIGIGTTKMKIHKAAIARLFESNNQVLDAERIYELGKAL